jgi:hypothetical protein
MISFEARETDKKIVLTFLGLPLSDTCDLSERSRY